MKERDQEGVLPVRPETNRRHFSIMFGASLLSLGLTVLDRFEGGRVFPPQKGRYLARTPEGYKIGILSGEHAPIVPVPSFLQSIIVPLKKEDLFLPVGAIFWEEVSD
jgi:hypothetical protein